MRSVSIFLGLALAIGGMSVAHRADAAPPRVQGYNCSALAASIGPAKVWRTNFRGEKRDNFDNFWPYSASPCFPSEKICKAWLYWAQSDYPDRNTFTPCKRLGH